jgi:hypothetical protein
MLPEDGDQAMATTDYDETRAIARLPNLDIEVLHRRSWQGEDEQISISVRAVPSFEAFGRFLEAGNPLLFWARMMQIAWSPWLPRIPPSQSAE